LRLLTSGRGVHKEEFSHYEEMPRNAEAELVEEYKKHRQEGHAQHE
jgi:elongation factor G